MLKRKITSLLFIFLSLFLSLLGWNIPSALAISNMPPAQEKAWKEWSYSLALQAATWGAPLVTMYTLRHHDALGPKAKAAPNSIWRMEDIATPELSKLAGYVTPNVNVIYGFGFMDLRGEPVILEVPDSNQRYYMVEMVDMYTNAFAYVGGRATGYKGGKFALVGPGWEGDLPFGIQRINAPTPWILLQPRVHIYFKGEVDLPGARKILENIKTTPLSVYIKQPAPKVSQYKNYPAPEPVNPDMPVSALNYKNPLQFWTLLSLAMNENPPPKNQIEALLPMFKALGIEFGKPWDPSRLSPQVLASMKEVAAKIGGLLANLPAGTYYQGAFIPPSSIGNPKNDYQTRAIGARMRLTANTPAESVYWIYLMDQKGQPLNGSKKYKMKFREGLPHYEPGFWSITLYDKKNNYTVPNPVNRYMLGSDTRSLKKNPDGSFTIYIQKDNPGGEKESNWLPAPAGPFYLIPRAYAPMPEIIEILSNVTVWPMPVITPVNE